jgi:uncharacterized protein
LIIDCHCHYGKGDGLTGPWDTVANLSTYLKRCTGYGISKTVLFPLFHSDYEYANLEVAKVVNSNPARFYGFIFVHPIRDRGKIFRMVDTAVKKYNFCGIKVHKYDGRITREICDTARLFNLPVLYDVMGETQVVELLANEYPDVNFIIPHFGNFADDWRSYIAFLPYINKYKNIYTDTAGVRLFDIIERAVYESGPQKILFGSDGPWLHPGVELEKIYALKLNSVDTDYILNKNFLKLISKIRKNTANAGNDRGIRIDKYEVIREVKNPWIGTN